MDYCSPEHIATLPTKPHAVHKQPIYQTNLKIESHRTVIPTPDALHKTDTANPLKTEIPRAKDAAMAAMAAMRTRTELSACTRIRRTNGFPFEKYSCQSQRQPVA